MYQKIMKPKFTNKFSNCTHIDHKDIQLTEEKIMDKLIGLERVFLFSKNQVENRGIIWLAWIGGNRFEVWYQTEGYPLEKAFIQEGSMEESIELFNKWTNNKRN